MRSMEFSILRGSWNRPLDKIVHFLPHSVTSCVGIWDLLQAQVTSLEQSPQLMGSDLSNGLQGSPPVSYLHEGARRLREKGNVASASTLRPLVPHPALSGRVCCETPPARSWRKRPPPCFVFQTKGKRQEIIIQSIFMNKRSSNWVM